jgi:opacity protein-like surface antigen
MVKCFCAIVFVALFALPALAQDEEFPRIEIGVGYGHVSLPDIDFLGVPLVQNGGHSGFVSQQGFNFTRWLGVENYLGYYGAGQGANFFTNVFGAKVAYRNLKKVVPYGAAGIGGSSLSINYQGSTSGFATRLAGGIDVPVNDSMAVRLDYSHISSHVLDDWRPSRNLSFGVVFTIGN